MKNCCNQSLEILKRLDYLLEGNHLMQKLKQISDSDCRNISRPENSFSAGIKIKSWRAWRSIWKDFCTSTCVYKITEIRLQWAAVRCSGVFLIILWFDEYMPLCGIPVRKSLLCSCYWSSKIVVLRIIFNYQPQFPK